jgi:hypothetical protein
MVQLPPPPQHPSAAQPDPDLQYAAESGQPVVDYPESPEPPRVSDLQQLFRDAEHRALRGDVNELPTAPRSGNSSVAGTEGFD